ncbi:MAG: hypothetical protein HON70_12460, partial [Lentisphaerae bacterium]|nr:hypothetical protein [Lentisphaerota bacterium]
MSSAVLSHRERVALALSGQDTDRVPIAMVCSGINAPARQDLTTYLAAHHNTSVDAFLEPLVDVRAVQPQFTGPPLAPRTCIWGVVREPVSYGTGHYNEIARYPLAEAEDIGDLDQHSWPSPDWYDYDGLPAQIAQLRAAGDHCLMAANGNIFETTWYMRGFEQTFMDLVLDPEFTHAIMERVCAFYEAFFDRVLGAAQGEIDLVFTADDIGGQGGLLMSLDMWEEHIKPYHVRLNRCIHSHGARVIYHSDGAVMDAVPGLVDMGIDLLQALQFDAAGMDPVSLKAGFGDMIGFEGGISVQHTLPFGS